MKSYLYFLAAASLVTYMQAGRAQDLEPLPDEYIPAAGLTSEELEDQLVEPEVKVRQAGNKTVKEFQERGRTYKVEVIPENTPAYILTDQDGSGELGSSNTNIDSGVVVPEWTIGSW